MKGNHNTGLQDLMWIRVCFENLKPVCGQRRMFYVFRTDRKSNIHGSRKKTAGRQRMESLLLRLVHTALMNRMAWGGSEIITSNLASLSRRAVVIALDWFCGRVDRGSQSGLPRIRRGRYPGDPRRTESEGRTTSPHQAK